MHSFVRHGEASSSDKVAAKKYAKEFKYYVKAEDFVSQQVFSCGKTGLFWKDNPNMTYIAQERSLPGHKLTLLLCRDASLD